MDVNEIHLEDKFRILTQKNINNNQIIREDIDSSYIQFHFVLKGNINFLFNNGSYKLNIEKKKYLMLYNPTKDLPLNINIDEKSTLICILISIDKFHKLFSSDTGNIEFLSQENINQKYYNENKISEEMLLVLNQILNNSDNHDSKNSLYLKAKTYELFSVIFQNKKEQNKEQCPFIINDEQIKKIKLAKEIIIERYEEPPTLIKLSEEVQLSLKKLKQGFKEVYGKPVFQYLLEYKMNLAKKLLSGGKYNVNEVSIKLGYSTASHFIAAFKKKFGITPRQYIVNNSY